MTKYYIITFLLLLSSLNSGAQNVRLLKGKSYEKLNAIKGFENYKPIKSYNVFDEMVCIRYQDAVTYQELMIFERTKMIDGKEEHLVADVLKIDGTGRYKILSVGYNKFAAYSEKNIIIAIEEVEEDGRYVLPQRSRKIHSAYTLEHKGHKFVEVPLNGLYRIGEDYFQERTTRY